MNPASVDIAELLCDSSSFAYVIGTDIFVGREPAQPYNSVTVFDVSGYPFDVMLAGNEGGTETAAAQIRVRNVDYRDGYEEAEAIRDYLHGLVDAEINGTSYDLIKCTMGPSLLDWTPNNCVRFIITIEVKRRS